MSQTLTYTIGADKRALVSDIQDFHIDFASDNSNWVQARQYEDSMRQVFVNVKNQDGTPYNLTGANIWFEGILPDKTHKILDAEHAVILDATNGQFRFDMPKQAFAVAGSYQQAFFRIVRDGASVTTLEFDLEVLADKVISNLVARDYITPFEDLYDQLEEIINKANSDISTQLANWTTEFQNKYNELVQLGVDVTNTLATVQARMNDLEAEIKNNGLFTEAKAEAFKNQISSDLSTAINNMASSLSDTTTKLSEQVQSTSADLTTKYSEMVTAVNNANTSNANLVNQKLSEITTVPETFASLSALQAAYPTGKAGLMVTADNGHKYIWSNNAWLDCGEYQTATTPDYVKTNGNLLNVYAKNGLPKDYKISGANGNTDSSLLNNYLNRDWLNITSNGKQDQYSGLVLPIAKTSGMFYPIEFSCDVQAGQNLTLNVQLCYMNADGSLLYAKTFNSTPLTLNQITTINTTLMFDQPYYDQASSFQIRIIDPANEVVNSIMLTDLSAKLIFASSAISTSDSNLLLNQQFAVWGGANWSLANYLGSNWVVLTSNNQQKQYVGLSFPIAKTNGMFYPIEFSCDVQAGQNLTLNVQLDYMKADGSLLYEKVFNSTPLTANQITTINTTLTFDQPYYDQASSFQIRILDPANEVVSSIMLTNLSAKLIFASSAISTSDSNLLLDQQFGIWGGASWSLANYLGSNWVVLTSNKQQMQYVGLSFPIAKTNGMFYPIEFSCDVQASQNLTLNVQLCYMNADGSLLYAKTFNSTPLTLNQATTINTTLTFDQPYYDQASSFQIRIIDPANEVVSSIMLTNFFAKLDYFGSGFGTSSSNSNITINGTSSLPVIKLTGDTSTMTKDNKVTMTFEYDDGARIVKGYSSTSWQGDSSLEQAKKAYRIRLYSDMSLQTKMKIKPNAQMAEDNQFNLKAYATDPLIGRDQVNATIGGEIWSTRDDLPNQMIGTNNFGFITGFPVLVYINGQLHGIHSFNTDKGDYGTDFTAFEGAVYSDATRFNALPTGGVKLDGTDFDMVNPDNPTDDLKTKINNFITFVATSSDDDYKAQLTNYVSTSSVIDYIIFSNIINNTDMSGKNEQFILYTGDNKFYMHPYDLDCTFGMNYDGSLVSVTEDILAPNNKLLSRTLSLFSDEVKARYTSLRTWLNAPYVINKYQELVNAIGEGNYEAEYALWKNNYSDFNYLKSAVYARFNACDKAWLTAK